MTITLLRARGIFLSLTAVGRAVRRFQTVLLPLFLVLLTAAFQNAKAAIITVTNNVAGSYTWVCPPGVNSVQVECWGGGGGGAGAVTSAGGGGAGGAYARTGSYAVVPGTNYIIQIGAAGVAGVAGNNPGGTGGSTWFSNSATAIVVLAAGGGGGAAGSSSAGGGIGGTSPAGSIGTDVTYLGGAGLSGVNNSYSGGGGSSAGNASDGNLGASSGFAPEVIGGGPGGAAKSTAGAGAAPTSGPGGGGGGGYSTGAVSRAGAAGFAGQVILTYSAPVGVLNWIGDGVNNFWSTNNADIDWDGSNNGLADSTYSDGALVVFGSEGTNNPIVTIGTTVAPTSISINSASNYVFTGSGGISGVTSLSVSGGSLVTINTTNSYSGGTTLSAGRILAGNVNALGTGLIIFSGGAFSSIGGAALTLSNAVTVTSASTLGDATDNGVITLTAPVDFFGSARSITNNSPVQFASGANDGRLGTKQGVGTLTINGLVNFNGAADVDNGTLIYDGATVTNSDRIIPDATAGNAARMVITNGTTVTINGTGNNLRSGRAGDITGTNYMDVAGLYSLPSTVLPNGFATLYGGCAYAEMTFWPGGDFTAFGVTNTGGVGNTAFKFNGGILRARTNNASFFQGLSSTWIQAGGANIDDGGFAIAINQNLLDGGGGGGLNKIGNGSLWLNGANTYTGTTLVSQGTLGGNGVISGPVSLAAGSTLAPGAANVIGTLTISNDLTLNVGSTVSVQVNGDNATSSSVAGLANVTYGGVLIVTNLGENQLAGGETFQLFNAAGTAAGNFSSIIIQPTTGATNAVFNPATGVLTINGNSSIPTTPTNLIFTIAGGNVNLSWPGNYLGWSLQVQTNSLGTNWIIGTNWITIPGSEGVTVMNFPIDTTVGAVFYRLHYQP
jgi:fibronectin-binding autotransporter adhesin